MEILKEIEYENRKNIKIFIREKEIKLGIEKVASQINKDYKNKKLIVVGILKGSYVFLADLVRNIEPIITNIDFIKVSSYLGTKNTYNIKLTKDLEVDIENKNILIVEDIADTGLTLKYLKELLKERSPNSIKTCVLLDKKLKRKVDFNVDYCCFKIPDKFVIGYGLDYKEEFRDLRNIYTWEKNET